MASSGQKKREFYLPPWILEEKRKREKAAQEGLHKKSEKEEILPNIEEKQEITKPKNSYLKTELPIIVTSPLFVFAAAMIEPKKEIKEQVREETLTETLTEAKTSKSSSISCPPLDILVPEEKVTFLDNKTVVLPTPAAKIVKTMEKEIVKEKDQLEILALEVKEVEKEVRELIVLSEVEEAEKKLTLLLEKIKEIKRKYELIKKNDDFSVFFEQWEDDFFLKQIDDWKYQKSPEEVTYLAHLCKHDLDQIATAVQIMEQGQEIKKTVVTQKKAIVVRQNQFAHFKTKIKVLSEEEVLFGSLILEQQSNLNAIATKIASLKDKEWMIVPDLSKIMLSTLGLSIGLSMMALSPIGMLGGALFTYYSLDGMRLGLRQKKILSMEGRIRQILRNIKDQRGILYELDHQLICSVEELDRLKMEYRYRYQDYADQITEYRQTIRRLEELRNDLVKKEEQVKQEIYRLDSYEKKSKTKLKKMDDIYDNF